MAFHHGGIHDLHTYPDHGDIAAGYDDHLVELELDLVIDGRVYEHVGTFNVHDRLAAKYVGRWPRYRIIIHTVADDRPLGTDVAVVHRRCRPSTDPNPAGDG